VRLDIANSDQFGRMLDALASDVVGAAIHSRLHSDLRSSIPSHATAFSQSPAFWSLTFGAHFDAFLSRLHRAYDQHPDSLSLVNLLDTISENLALFASDSGTRFIISPGAHSPDPGMLAEHRQSVAPSDPLVKRLIALRGNVYAHRNALNVIEELGLERRFGLSFDDLEDLTQRAVGILNTYSGLFRGSTWSTRMVGHDDYRIVLEAVQRDTEHQDAAVRREIQGFEGQGTAT